MSELFPLSSSVAETVSKGLFPSTGVGVKDTEGVLNIGQLSLTSSMVTYLTQNETFP